MGAWGSVTSFDFLGDILRGDSMNFNAFVLRVPRPSSSGVRSPVGLLSSLWFVVSSSCVQISFSSPSDSPSCSLAVLCIGRLSHFWGAAAVLLFWAL